MWPPRGRGGRRTPREGKQRPHYTGGGGEGGCKANTQLGPEAGSALLTGRLDAAGPAPTARGYREDRKEAKPAEAHRARSAAPGTVGGSRQSQQSRAGPGPPTAPARAETGHGRQAGSRRREGAWGSRQGQALCGRGALTRGGRPVRTGLQRSGRRGFPRQRSRPRLGPRTPFCAAQGVCADRSLQPRVL